MEKFKTDIGRFIDLKISALEKIYGGWVRITHCNGGASDDHIEFDDDTGCVIGYGGGDCVRINTSGSLLINK